jgi:hypothetical protein
VIIVVRGIHVKMPAMIVIAVIEVAVRVAMIDVVAPPEIVAMIAVRALHIARTATLAINAAVVGTLYVDCAVAIQPAMHVHAPADIVHIAGFAVRPVANGAAAMRDALMAALGRETIPDVRVAAEVRVVRATDVM